MHAVRSTCDASGATLKDEFRGNGSHDANLVKLNLNKMRQSRFL